MARKTTNLRRRGRSWEVYYRANGKQRSKSFADADHGGTAGAREAALLFLTQEQAKVIRGQWHAPTKIAFAEFAAEWLADYARAHVGPKTYEGYEGVLRVHLIPHFGELLLPEISRKAIDAFVADWSAGGLAFQRRLAVARELEATRAKLEGRDPRVVRLGRSPKTIANALVPLREMLGHAVEWGYLAANPAAGVRRPRVESNHDEMRCLDASEVGKLLAAAAKDAYGHAVLLTAVTTGMRRGEQLGLRWGDVDWTAGRIFVRRSIGPGGVVQQPKTRGSVRAIAMTATLASTLKRHRMAVTGKELEDYVFPSQRGTPLEGRNVARRYLDPALKRARLASMRWHDLRHTYASLLIAQGAHPKLIQEQLGHASITITLDRYGHLMDQSVGDAGAQLEAALFGASATPADASVLPAPAAQTVPRGVVPAPVAEAATA